MSESAKRSVRTSVILSEAQHTCLSMIAKRSDVSVAWVIRQAVHQFLEKAESEQIPLPIHIMHGSDENV
jgi:predicted transcriptional regulator